MIRYEYFRSTELFTILRMVSENFEYHYHPGIFLASHQEWPEGFITARYGSRIVGFVMGKVLDMKVRILLFAVQPEFRKRGVGAGLLRQFEQEVAALDVVKIILEVRASNARAIKFYRFHGFVESGFVPGFYSSGEGAVAMTRYLRS